jgi:hypothetical protein
MQLEMYTFLTPEQQRKLDCLKTSDESGTVASSDDPTAFIFPLVRDLGGLGLGRY